MAHKHKQILLSDSNLPAAAAAPEEPSRTVFIDTSLDTHLLMLLSRYDTVSHFKRKIEKEHALCFTGIGEIVVRALKVKRRGHLYHLSDSMLVRDAFVGANKNWFLSVDVSTVEKKRDEEKRVQNLDSDNLLPYLGAALADGADLPLNHSPEQGTSDPNKGSKVPLKLIEFENDMPGRDIFEQQGMSVEEASQPVVNLTKKRKVEQIVGNGHLQQEEIESGKDALKPAIVSQHTSVDKERGENGAVDGSAAKPVDDSTLVTTNSLSLRQLVKLRETKSKLDKVADGVPSSGKDVVSTGVVGNGHLQQEEIESGKDTTKPATVSQHTSVDKESGQNGAVDGSAAKPVDDNTLVTTNSPSIHQKKKRRKTKSKLDKVADGVPSSGKEVVSTGVNHKDSGVEPNTASVHGGGEDGIITPESKQKHSDTIREAREPEPLTVEVGRKIAATEEDTTSAVSKVEHSRDHFPADGKSNPYLVMKDPKEHQMSFGVPEHKDIGGDRAEKAAEQGALSKKNGSVGKQSKKLDSHSQDETEVQTKDINVTTDLVGQSGTIAPTDTNKKRKRTKKTQDLVGKALTTSGRDDIQASETNVNVEPLTAKGGVRTRNEESNLPSTIENEVLDVNKESTFVAEESDDITGNDIKNTQKTIDKMEKAGNMEEEPVRKSKKKKPKSSSKNLPALQVENRDVIRQNITPPTVDKSEVVASSNTKKKDKVEKPIKDQSNGGKLESENFAVKTDPVLAEPSSLSANSTKAQSRFLDHGNKGSSVEAHLSDNTNETNNQIEASGVGNRSNLGKLLPDNVTSSEVLVDKKTAANRAAKVPKATKNVKKPDLNSAQTSSDVQSSLKSNNKRQIEGSSLKERSDESMAHPGKKLPKASKNASKAPSSIMPDTLNLIPKETGKHSVANVTGTAINAKKKADSASVSNSGLERPKKIASQSATSNKYQSGIVSSNLAALAAVAAAAAKFSNKDNGATVNSSEPKKNLIAMPGSIFKDDSVASSEDERTDSSDGSTRTPSDYSSDYSDGESNANLKSPQKGSHTLDRTKSVDRKSIIKSCSSSGKDLSLDSILRSSSRYKKAKVTASQLQLEEESQAVDFVPDSQAD